MSEAVAFPMCPLGFSARRSTIEGCLDTFAFSFFLVRYDAMLYSTKTFEVKLAWNRHGLFCLSFYVAGWDCKKMGWEWLGKFAGNFAYRLWDLVFIFCFLFVSLPLSYGPMLPHGARSDGELKRMY